MMGIGNSELQGERSRAPRSQALRQGPLGLWTHSGEPAPGRRTNNVRQFGLWRQESSRAEEIKRPA